MSSIYFLVLCSLLQADHTGAVTPRVPVAPVMSFPPVATQSPQQSPTTPPVVPHVVPPAVPPAGQSNQLHLRNGVLVLPIHNKAPMAAPQNAVLMSLRTEQRDTAGNVLRDNEGHPIMVPLRQGMHVFKGQVLGNFDDRELCSLLKISQAQLDVAIAERDNDIEKVAAARSLQVAFQDLKMMHNANKQIPGSFQEVEIRRQELVRDHAEATMELKKYSIDEIKTREVTVQESRLAQTKVQIEERKLIAPIDGMIVKIDAAEGVWLREGQPVLELVQLDTLWVQVQVSIKDREISEVDGKQAVVHVTFANGKKETFPGMVVFCEPSIESGDVFRAFIEMQNRRVGNHWLLQPGRSGVEVVISL
jgi:biotin carboxyl carrier protein